MSDTPESVRKAAIRLELLPAYKELRNLRDMLERYAELLERSAGVWVPVVERLPEADEWTVIHDRFGELYFCLLQLDGTWIDREYDLSEPTHWLDARLP